MVRRVLLGTAVLLTATGVWNGVPAAAEFIRIDVCLDQGGRYDYAVRRCESAPAPASSIAAAEPASADTIPITGNTVVAYFVFTSTDGNSMDAYADFMHYLPTIEQGLDACGVRLVMTDASVVIARGQMLERFDPRALKVGVGYRMMGPGRRDLTLEGVQTDADLLDAAAEHFGLRAGCRDSGGAPPA
jgi:hypothetical protein